jgi:predicted O-methyltransferase YrrM
MSFEAAWSHAQSIGGWLTEQQARMLFDAATEVPEGQAIVEIGSHHGRSTVLLASAKKPGVTLLAVDPYDDQRWGGGQDAFAIFQSNLRSSGVESDVTLARKYGADAGRDWTGAPIRLLFVDGAHDYQTVVADLAAWMPHVLPAGSL